ncbi:MAG TPA: FtsX-like permease family protein, partial [Gemmatimonadaceae bacterium]|nr:FtsX-like permease family protein [Gemmatimonadaceae bacterium]
IVRAYREIGDAVAAVPGVRALSLAVTVPLSGSSIHSSFVAEGKPVAPGERPTAALNIISPGYFATLGIPMLDGRDLVRTDDASSPEVVIVSQSLARQLWPGERAVGKRIDAWGSGGTPRWMEVVGVVGDLHGVSLTETAEPALYVPYAQIEIRLWQAMQRSLVIVARTAPEPATLLPAIRRAVTTVDPSLPLADNTTMEELLAGSLATARFNTQLLTTLGLIALLLASVGVYGVVAYFVSQRTQEIGLRMALGATPGHVWRLVVRRGMAPIVWGVAVGAGMSLATARLLRGQLYGVGANDPATLAGVAVLLLAVAVLATYVPARRAMRVAPAVALGTG